MVFEDREQGPEGTITALALYPDDLDHGATSGGISRWSSVPGKQACSRKTSVPFWNIETY